MQQIKRCEFCDKELTDWDGRSKYCSTRCRSKAAYARRREKSGIKPRAEKVMLKLVCEYCGKPFEAPSWQKDRKYCSRECANRSIHGSLKGTEGKAKTCECCGRPFVQSGYVSNQRFCSRECRDIAYAAETAEKRRQYNAAYRARKKAEALNKSSVGLTLDETAALATAHKVSYGTMMAWLHANGRLPEPGEIIR